MTERVSDKVLAELVKDKQPGRQSVVFLVAEELIERRAKEREDLRAETNANCSCGGRGPNDPLACEACLKWHRERT